LPSSQVGCCLEWIASHSNTYYQLNCSNSMEWSRRGPFKTRSPSLAHFPRRNLCRRYILSLSYDLTHTNLLSSESFLVSRAHPCCWRIQPQVFVSLCRRAVHVPTASLGRVRLLRPDPLSILVAGEYSSLERLPGKSWTKCIRFAKHATKVGAPSIPLGRRAVSY
jgi:hypothetical protein